MNENNENMDQESSISKDLSCAATSRINDDSNDALKCVI